MTECKHCGENHLSYDCDKSPEDRTLDRALYVDNIRCNYDERVLWIATYAHSSWTGAGERADVADSAVREYRKRCQPAEVAP